MLPTDALVILRRSVGSTTPYQERFEFVEESVDLSGVSRGNVVYESAARTGHVVNLQQDSRSDLVGLWWVT